jgi:subtilisin family serine protease
MKRTLAVLPLLALAAACADAPSPLATGADSAPSASAAAGEGGRYVVVLEPGADPRSVAAVMGIHPRNVYTAALNGFAADLNAGQLNALRHNPRVAYVEPDAPARLATTQSPATWGIDRIDQSNLPLSNSFTYTSQGRGVRIYVLDTGVRLTHTEFGGRAAYIGNGTGGNFVGDAAVDAADCHGHGTHVSATAAGVRYGVAKLAYIRAGRVVDCAGNGNASMVIAALDWIILNGIKPGVVNMSLGYGNVQSVRDATQAVYAAGYVPVAAAGNGDFAGTPQNACSQAPAGATNALTVGSTRSDDTESSFSNYGRCVDLLAPGSGITSAWIGGDLATNVRSGTSMAAPHAAGVAAQILYNSPAATPLTVMNLMKAIATPGVITLHALSAGNYTPNRLLFTSY